MDNFFYSTAIYAWLSLTILFFMISFLVKQKFIWITVVLNIIFFTVSYVVVAETVGQGKPITNSVPLYHHADWSKEGIELLTVWWNDKKIYLLLEENDKPILYVVDRTDKLVDELSNAIIAAQKNGGKILLEDDLSNNYGDAETTNHIHIKENPQHSYMPKADQGDNIENYDTPQ